MNVSLKINDYKGITMISLLITIVVLAILTSVVVSVGVNVTSTAKFEDIETYLLLIQSKSKIMAEKLAMGEISESDMRGEKQSSGEYEGWYKLSQGDLNDIGLSKAKAEDGYYVDYTNDDVAYSVGITFDGQEFYRLSEILAYTNGSEG